MSTKITQAIYFLGVFFAATFVMQAQSIYRGKVIDAATQLPIPQVEVMHIASKKAVQTDANGVFSIEITGTKALFKCSHRSYASQQLVLSSKKKNIISLQPNIEALDAVMINGITLEQQLEQASESVSIIGENEIYSENTVQLAAILNRVPGVFMQSGSLNTNRITIRGIGARSPFATANIRAYFADIPLTDGNGESAIEDLELASISRMEIHKGPASSSYGVGLGGTILLYPEYAKFNETTAQIFSTVGSYGLFKTIAKVAHGSDTANVNFVYSNTHSDGYRANNSLDRATATLTSNWYVNDRNELTLLTNCISLKAFIPSSLNREDFENTPRNAATIWQRARGFEDAKKTLVGFNWKHIYNETFTQKTSIFVSTNRNYEPRPFNILEEESTAFGVRSRVLATHDFEKSSLQWSVGGELFFDDYNAKQFENLYQDFPEGTGSVAGNIMSDTDENRNYVNLFAEAIYSLNKFTISAGMHVNQTVYKTQNKLVAASNEKEFTFETIVSPKIGVNYQISDTFRIFGTIANGFSTPTAAETLLPNGVFNPEIAPERGWNFEIGTRFHTTNKKFSGTVSVYSMHVRDMLVNRRTATDQNITLNAGKTTHRGIEASLNYQWFHTEQYVLNSYANMSINDFFFKDFVEVNANFSGNDLTGVPKSVVNLGVELTNIKGWFSRFDFQAVGEMPANDENTLYSDAFKVLNGKIGYKNMFGSKWQYEISVGANNITNTKYVSQLQVNAFGNDTTARYFYPGLPFNMYGGVQLTYTL